jgi:hypothetical protein
MKRMSLLLAIVLGLLIVNSAIATDWDLFAGSEDCTAYYDPESITQISPNIFRVSTKHDWTEKFIARVMEIGGREQGYENFSCSVTLNEINCIEKKIYFLSHT